jgi:hypothetical protein
MNALINGCARESSLRYRLQRSEKAQTEVAGKTQRQRTGDGIGELQPPQAAVAIGLDQAAALADAAEMDGASRTVADLDFSEGKNGHRLG